MKTTKSRNFFQQTSMVVLFTLLTLSLPVLAQSSNSQNNDFRKSDSQGLGSTDTDSKIGRGGRREICPNSNRELYLVFDSDRDRTASSHPTFAWFVVSPDLADIEFRLYEGTREDADNARIIGQPIKNKVRGLSTYSLPTNEPGLAPNKSYFWQVSLFCDPDRTEGPIWDRAHFEVVEMPRSLEMRLQNTADRCETIALYTAEGLWYDALKEMLNLMGVFQLETLASFTQQDELSRLLEFTPTKNDRFSLPCHRAEHWEH